jgi:hypothetical protein
LNNNDIDISYALLATQRALLGEVTPNLRAVIIDLITEDKRGSIFFSFTVKYPKQILILPHAPLPK